MKSAATEVLYNGQPAGLLRSSGRFRAIGTTHRARARARARAELQNETPSFIANGYLAYDDFFALGTRLGLPPSRVRRLLTSRRQRLRYSLAGAR